MNFRYSEDFNINRGTFQGVPLLFALAIEPLANLITNSIHNTIQIHNKTHIINLFVDNVVLFLSSPKNSLDNLSDVLNLFFKVSGLRINKAKSELYPMWTSQQLLLAITCNHHFVLTKSSWTHLGIQISVNFQEICKINFRKIVNECKLSFDKWDKMNMSWNDRMKLVKAFIFPKFLYLFRSLPLPLTNQDLKKWQKFI